MDPFNWHYLIQRAADVQVGGQGNVWDINLDDINDDDNPPSPIPSTFRMQGALAANTSDQIGYLDESGPPENPHNLYNFSFLFTLNNNAHLNLTRLNFDISTLGFTNNGNFTEGNNPIAFDEDDFTFDSNGNPTNMGFNLSLNRYNDCMIAISNGPDTAFVDGDAYNIAGVLAPASDFVTPVSVQEFAAGAFYPSSVTTGNFGTGGGDAILSFP